MLERASTRFFAAASRRGLATGFGCVAQLVKRARETKRATQRRSINRSKREVRNFTAIYRCSTNTLLITQPKCFSYLENLPMAQHQVRATCR